MPRMAITWAVMINVPAERVFSYMRDPNNLFHGMAGGNPDFEFHDVKVTPEGVGTTAWLEVHLPGLQNLGPTGKVSIEITEVVPNRRIVVKSFMAGRIFKFDGTWTWTFEPGNGGTTLVVDYTELASWPVYVFDRLTEKLQSKEMDAYLADLKTTLESHRDSRERSQPAESKVAAPGATLGATAANSTGKRRADTRQPEPLPRGERTDPNTSGRLMGAH